MQFPLKDSTKYLIREVICIYVVSKSHCWIIASGQLKYLWKKTNCSNYVIEFLIFCINFIFEQVAKDVDFLIPFI